MFREYAEILTNECTGKEHYLMRIRAPRISRSWKPGQFINVLPPQKSDRAPLLRRPFSILGSHGDEVEFVYRVVGDGTRLLADSTPGGTLDIIGPLGNGFEIEPSKKGRYILIAGGVGIPPILALVRLLISQNLKIEFYYGSRDRDTLIFHDALLSMPIKSYFATEDGSLGHMGFVSEILPDDKSNIACVYACGPLDMLKAICRWRGGESFKYFASIENRMGCGVGVCLGCSIPTADGGYKLTCRDGPVFDADMVSWEKL